MVLVPAVMKVLDERAWYLPAWLDRVLPDLELEGSVEPPDQEDRGPDAEVPRQRRESEIASAGDHRGPLRP
jgi:RND superfamily putative drug exporter